MNIHLIMFVQQFDIPDFVSIIDLKKVNCYLIEVDKGFILIDTGFSKSRLIIDEFLSNKGITPENQVGICYSLQRSCN